MPNNLLLIQTDQMHARAMSCAGNPNVRTPNLDRLAEEGVLFTDANCNSPICMPSRASMLAGQYVGTLHQFGFGGLCDRRTPWMHQAFKRGGYQTGAFGKFHLSCVSPEQWDFDLAASDLPEDVDFARPPGWTYEAYCEEHGIAWLTDQLHGHIPFARFRPDVRGKGQTLPSGAAEALHPYVRNAWRSDVPLEHSIETWETDRCIEGIERFRANGRPWFAWLSYHRPHTPTPLPEPWFSRIRDHELQLPPMPSAEDLASWPRSIFAPFAHGPSRVVLGDEAFRFVVASYLALVEYIDSEIGRLLARLREWGLDASTSIVFTSDHGDDAGDRGCYDKFGIFTASEGVTRVPLIIRPAPALTAANTPRTIDEPVELVDIAPTSLRLCGLDVPEQMEGRDLSPALLRGEPLDPDRPVVCEESHRRMIKRGGWRLLMDQHFDDECILNDLGRDPHGMRNLYASDDPAVTGRRLQLKRDLLSFLVQRIYGPSASEDEVLIRGWLDANDRTQPMQLSQAGPRVMPFRAAAAVTMGDLILFVPFFDEPMYLFPAQADTYFVRDHALPFDGQAAETRLDWGVRELMRVTHMNSGAIRPESPEPPEPVTLDEARAALAQSPRFPFSRRAGDQAGTR